MKQLITLTPWERAIEYFNGNQAALARAIDPLASTMIVTHWKNRGVPASRYHQIQQACGGTVTTEDFYFHAKQSPTLKTV
jgi:hypothetical protein